MFVKNYELIRISSITNTWQINDEGWFSHELENSLIMKTAHYEYQYLLKGNKNIINTDIHFDTNSRFEIYDTTVINGKGYWLRRLTDIDVSSTGLKASTEWVEI